jgi:hypothetical protein
MKCRLLLVVGVALASACLSFGVTTGPAYAGIIYDWSYNGTACCGSAGPWPVDTGSGTLTIGAADQGGFDITGVTGTWNSFTITGLAYPPGNLNNVLFPTSPFLTANAAYTVLSDFAFSDSNSNDVYIFYNPIEGFPSPYIWTALISGTNETAGTFSITPEVSVPGPIVGAGLPGLVAACGGLLAWLRRRRKAA